MKGVLNTTVTSQGLQFKQVVLPLRAVGHTRSKPFSCLSQPLSDCLNVYPFPFSLGCMGGGLLSLIYLSIYYLSLP